MKEHKDDGEKLQEYKKKTAFSQHMKTTEHSLYEMIKELLLGKINGKRESSKKQLE